MAVATNNTMAESMPNDFTKLNTIYRNQVTKLKNIRDDDLDNIAPNYLANLKNLEKHYQTLGNLSPLIIVRKEYTRFSGNPKISEIVIANSPTALRKLQNDILKSGKDIKIKCAESIIDLGERYKKRLISLQKTLTQNGNIEDAIKIMHEIENINSYPAIMAAYAQIDAGGTLDTERRKTKDTYSTYTDNTTETNPAPKPTTRKLNKKSLEDYFHTRITRWNSATHEITCHYSFATEKQIDAWSNASFDQLRNRLLCDNTVSWFKPLFSSIKKIECDGYYFEGSGPIRIMLGKSLYADLLPTADDKAVLHQGNASYPLEKSHGRAEQYVCYHNKLNIDGGNVQWSITTDLQTRPETFMKTKLLKPISTPIRIGLGNENAKTMFSDIRITGILSPITIKKIVNNE